MGHHSRRVCSVAAAVALLCTGSVTLAIAHAQKPDRATASIDDCPDPEDFAASMLRAHNRFRALHGSPPLKLDEEISADAQEWADHLAETGEFKHSGASGYGENISQDTARRSFPTAEDITVQWYAEEARYNYDGLGSDAPNFTQLVWASTKRLGVGVACGINPENGFPTMYTVADYDPAGNILGQYRDNVRPPN